MGSLRQRWTTAREGETEEIVEGPRRRLHRPVANPGAADIHGRDVIRQEPRPDPLPFQRPRAIYQIGEYRDSRSGRYHAAHRFPDEVRKLTLG